MEIPAFQVFLDDYRDDVFRFLVASVGRNEAEDCLQETFLAALRAYPRLRKGSNLRSWIFTIAHRKAIDSHRNGRRLPRPVETLPEQAASPQAEEVPFARLVEALPHKQRAAVTLRYLAGMPYREIGHVIECSEDAARQNVRAGLRTLREEWER